MYAKRREKERRKRGKSRQQPKPKPTRATSARRAKKKLKYKKYLSSSESSESSDDEPEEVYIPESTTRSGRKSVGIKRYGQEDYEPRQKKKRRRKAFDAEENDLPYVQGKTNLSWYSRFRVSRPKLQETDSGQRKKCELGDECFR